MKLIGTSVSQGSNGWPLLGGGTFIGGNMNAPLQSGMPLEIEGTNGRFSFEMALVTTISGNVQLSIYATGSLAISGQPIPIKAITFTNNTVPSGSGTVYGTDFGVGVIDSGKTLYQSTANQHPFLANWTAAGGDDFDFVLEFDNSVLGTTVPSISGSIMKSLVG